MADIELVIKIPEEEYRWIKKSNKTVFADVASKECMLHAIKTGTPLPKGHGRLKDIDKIISDGRSKGFCDWYDEMKYAETVIEADKASKGDENGSN